MFSLARVFIQDKRTFPRRRTRWQGILKHDESHRPCIVEDISVGGCRIAVNTKDMKFRDRVVIEIESQKLRFHGEVRWTKNDEAGVEFLYMD
ncbi:MAG: PilZ domain-containing protein [Roseibium sp.]|uniref:PilZ domain-containing protein n=1 Tax=Roseibium sp. TaxID=1936156 RepID=UPI001B16DBDC|nr:PilZ domain-containing protein [Roseibium sp.]MBO6893779.1 PilZ domain-containing protein [Roseibium sp.]MBO6933151.1 PilZ domain-containing protein [Roseibium sp.]